MNCNNKFGECCNCPALMSDGRLFTNYMLNSKLVSYIKEVNNLSNDTEFRHFLQKKGHNILKNEKSFLEKNKICNFEKEKN
jgi:hypothetical protein